MFIEPGIFDLAHSKGIKFIEDVNHDGRIDKNDMNITLAKQAKAAQGGTNVRPEHSGS
jgi:hypothetical protein